MRSTWGSRKPKIFDDQKFSGSTSFGIGFFSENQFLSLFSRVKRKCLDSMQVCMFCGLFQLLAGLHENVGTQVFRNSEVSQLNGLIDNCIYIYTD